MDTAPDTQQTLSQKISLPDIINRYITVILSIFFMTGSVNNILNIGHPDYISLSWLHLENLRFNITIVIFIAAFIYKFQKHIIHPLLITASLFFNTLYLHNISVSTGAGIILCNIVIVILNHKLILKNRFLSAAYLTAIIYGIKYISFTAILETIIYRYKYPAGKYGLYSFIISAILIPVIYKLFNRKDRSGAKILIPVLILIMTLVIGIPLMFRYYNYATTTYDFNLFTQMFYSMSEKFVPYTTLERNRALSHFAVHMSPVYYFMLPFFMITKDPATLQLLQGFVVALGLIPTYIITKNLKLTNLEQKLILILYVIYPVFTTSNSYDLHENCFLLPFVLSLLCAIQMKNKKAILIFTILTLTVKEDAVIYVWCAAIYAILEYGLIKEGLLMLTGGSLYFGACVVYLSANGDGAMLGRFGNFMFDKNFSILGVPVTILNHPALFTDNILKNHRLNFILTGMAGLSFTPLLHKKYSRWVLLLPYILINLMSDWPYQADILFQYNYGTHAMLFYLLILFIAEHKNINLKAAIFAGAFAFSLYFSVPFNINHMDDVKAYYKNEKNNTYITEILMKIPKDRSVTADGYLTGHLADRAFLYDTVYNCIIDEKAKTAEMKILTDYVIMDTRKNRLQKYSKMLEPYLKDKGYKIIFNEKETVKIYQSPEVTDSLYP